MCVVLENSEPEFESVSIHTIEVVLVEVALAHKPKIFIERESHLIGHLGFQHHLG